MLDQVGEGNEKEAIQFFFFFNIKSPNNLLNLGETKIMMFQGIWSPFYDPVIHLFYFIK